MPNKDPVLVDLVNQQTALFNRNAPVESKIKILKKIQEYQKEHREK